MNRLILVISCMVLTMMTACSNPQSQPEETAVEKPKPPLATHKIGEKAEIEVIDLTGEVALYVVLAGAYSTRESASKKADILKNAGFTNADVIQRPGSKLYSALVERFDSEAAAKTFAEQIASNKEIKSFVYKLDE